MSFIAATLRSQSFVTLKTVCQELPKCASCYQTVRWRKPRWVPVSASKQFYVRTPTIFDPEEEAELKIRIPHYNTTMKAVRRYLAENYASEKRKSKIKATEDTEEQEEFEMLMEENRKWNERVALQREQRQAEEDKIIQAKINRKLERKLESRAKQEEKAEKILQRYMDDAANDISLENLDAEIEKLLNSRKDYNYAIDLDGSKITDFDNLNPKPKIDKVDKTDSDSKE